VRKAPIWLPSCGSSRTRAGAGWAVGATWNGETDSSQGPEAKELVGNKVLWKYLGWCFEISFLAKKWSSIYKIQASFVKMYRFDQNLINSFVRFERKRPYNSPDVAFKWNRVAGMFQMGRNKSEVKQSSYLQVSLVKSVLLFGSPPSPNASSL